MTSKFTSLAVLTAGLLFPSLAQAQPFSFNFADDLRAASLQLQEDEEEEEEDSVADERKAVESGRIEKSGPGTDDDDLASMEQFKTNRTIKVLQKKNFLKIGRGEAGAHLGFVSNDPYLNRYLVGLNLGYHITEVFSVEFAGTFSPDFGDADFKPVTRQLRDENSVIPDISKIIWMTGATAQFSPIYGKIAVTGGRIIVFDFYGTFGFGLAGTSDDLEAIDCQGREGDPCTATANQIHPTTIMGGGFRVAFNSSVAARIDVRRLSYVEVFDGVSLQLKDYVIIQGMGTIFFDTRRK